MLRAQDLPPALGDAGGWGPPAERDPHLVKEDLLDGFVTPEQARSVYGLKG